MKILAVDDNNDILMVLKLILEDSGYDVETLNDGEFLFEKINEQFPDLILLDVMLGKLDGRELCRDVKRNIKTHDIPVIMISATHETKDILHKVGSPNAFLAKPFDMDELLDAVKSHLPAA